MNQRRNKPGLDARGNASFGPSSDDKKSERPARKSFNKGFKKSFSKEGRGYKPAPDAPADTEERQTFVCGVNAVEALLEREASRVHRVVFKKDSGNPRLYELQKKAKKNGIHTQQLQGKFLDKFNPKHQGVVAFCHEKPLDDWTEMKRDLVDKAKANVPVIIVIASNIEDPRNLGAAIRSSLGLGVDCLLIPARGACGITPLTAKTSAGALEKLPICRPDNLEKEVGILKQIGFSIIGLDGDTEKEIHTTELPKQMVLVVGGENAGIPPYLAKQCDHILRIPMNKAAHSFNTSVALSLALYEAQRQRLS